MKSICHCFLAASLFFAGQTAFAQTYTWTTIAGLGGVPGAVDGVGSAARLDTPFGIALDSAGNLLVSDSGNNLVRKLTPSGTNWAMTTILGGNTHNFNGGDGTGTNAAFNYPLGIAAASAGQFFEIENNSLPNAYLRQITVLNGVWSVTTLHVGKGLQGLLAPTGETVSGLAIDGAGELFVAVTGANQVYLAVSQGVNWTASPIAGTTMPGTNNGANLSAQFNALQGIAADAFGNVYIADTGNHMIRKLARDPITPDWITTTIAGQAGVAGFLDGTNGATLFNTPDGMGVDAAGNVFVSDGNNNVIRKLSLQGTNWVASTIGGQLNRFHGTADGVGTAASFYHPAALTVDNLGRLFVADFQNHTIRMGVPSVVTNPPPVLQMPVSGGVAYVLWPSSATGYVLQTSTNLNSGTWQTVASGITTNLVFTGPMTNAQNFYRLQQP